MSDERRIQRMVRKVGLHDDLARHAAPPCAPGDLLEQRKEPLGRAEVGAVERIVRAEHAHQRETREIVSFREHLRSDQDIDFARLYGISHLRKRAFSARAVAIDPQYSCAGIEL